MNRSGAMLLAFASGAFALEFGLFGKDPYEEAQRQADLQYPKSQYLSAVASSTASAEDAEMHARTDIAKLVDQTIESEQQSMIAQNSSNGSTTLKQEIISIAKVATRFEHAEIIVCDPAHKTRDGWIVIAHLSRKSALIVLEQQYEDTASRFRRRAGEALASRNLAEFSQAWHEALGLGCWLKLQGWRFATLAGVASDPEAMGSRNPHPEFQQDMALLEQIDSSRTRWLGQESVVMDLEAFPAFAPVAAQTLMDAGLKVVPKAKADSWHLSLSWKREVGESSFGEIMRCTLVPVLLLEHQGVRHASSPLETAKSLGREVQDTSAACAEALRKADPSRLKAPLRTFLTPYFPLL